MDCCQITMHIYIYIQHHPPLQPATARASLYVLYIHVARHTCGFKKKEALGRSPVNHHSGHFLHQFTRQVNRNFGHSSSSTSMYITHISSNPLCELDDNFSVCPHLLYGQYSFGSQHCQPLVTQLLLQSQPRFKGLTKTVVKCRRGYMWRARFVGSYTVEREALRRSLNGLELHLHIPDNTMSNTTKTSQPLAYSKKSREFRSSVTKSGSTPGGFPCMALPPGTEMAH